MTEDFLHLPPVSTAPVVHLELQISPRIFEKNLKWPKWYTQELGGNWFIKKTRSRKSRDTVPLRTNRLGGWSITLLKISFINALICELALNKSQPWGGFKEKNDKMLCIHTAFVISRHKFNSVTRCGLCTINWLLNPANFSRKKDS